MHINLYLEKWKFLTISGVNLSKLEYVIPPTHPAPSSLTRQLQTTSNTATWLITTRRFQKLWSCCDRDHRAAGTGGRALSLALTRYTFPSLATLRHICLGWTTLGHVAHRSTSLHWRTLWQAAFWLASLNDVVQCCWRGPWSAWCPFMGTGIGTSCLDNSAEAGTLCTSVLCARFLVTAGHWAAGVFTAGFLKVVQEPGPAMAAAG